MNIGVNNKRPARLNICQGSDLTTAMKRTAAYPANKALRVWSGEPVMAVAKLENADGVEFQNINAATPKNVWWAFSDYDNGRDFDNMAIKKLDAIYGGDKFEITTPFFDKSVAYLPGDKLYLTNETTNAVSAPKGGWIITSKKPESGDVVVIGRVSDGVIALGGDGVEHGISVAPTDDSADQFIVGGPRTYTNDTSSKFVLKFFTELA